jgi:hypothetical protein
MHVIVYILCSMHLHEYSHGFVSNSLICFEFIQICTNMFWIDLKIFGRTLPRAQPNSRTLPHTAARTAALPDTAMHFAANCSTLHTFECCTRHTAYRIPHTAHSRKPLLTWFKTVLCESICFDMNFHVNLCETIWIQMNNNNFIWIHSKFVLITRIESRNLGRIPTAL